MIVAPLAEVKDAFGVILEGTGSLNFDPLGWVDGTDTGVKFVFAHVNSDTVFKGFQGLFHNDSGWVKHWNS